MIRLTARCGAIAIVAGDMARRIGIHQGGVILAAKIDLDVDALPARVDMGPSRGYKAVQIVVGLTILGVLSVVWSYGVQGIEALVIVSVFAATGAILVAYGVYLLPLYRRATFSAGRVSVQHRTWGGIEQWSLPYSDYAGVLAKERRVIKGKYATTVQMIELHHRNPDRSVLLYAKESDTLPRAKWEKYARAFNLPALEESGARISPRPLPA